MKVKDSGIIYRNPKPHVKSIHAYFPSVVDLGGGELFASMILGEAFESVNCRIYRARSMDNGRTWSLEGRMLPEDKSRIYSEACRLTRLEDGSLVSVVFKHHRHRDNEGLANPETLGFVEVDMYLYRSYDGGRSWLGPQEILPPLEGPSFELCAPIVELDGETWIFPTSTWRDWDGSQPNGMKAVAFISKDHGNTWPQYVDVMDGSKDSVIYWEQKIIQLEPDKLLAIAWAYDEKKGKDLENAYSVSLDGGKTFSFPGSTGLFGQTPAIISLSKSRVLCAYRRVDIPGLWATILEIDGYDLRVKEQHPIWGAPSITGADNTDDMIKKFNLLRFGAPTLTKLQNGQIYLAFWCVEDCVSNIRWVLIENC